MRLQTWKRSARIAFVLCTIALIVLLSSQHRVRLIFTSFRLVSSADDLNWDPATSHVLRFEHFTNSDSAASAHMRAARIAGASGSASTVWNAIAVLTHYSQTNPTAEGDPLPAIDDPDSSLQYQLAGRSMHCYNVDIATVHLLRQYGVYARLWDLNGPEQLGAHGHNLLEVWDAPSRTWRVVDPYYHCHFVTADDTVPLSFGALRKLALTTPAAIHVIRYAHLTRELPPDWVVSELHFLTPFSALHVNNDYRWRYDHRYGLLMPFASLLDRLPLRLSRAARTIMISGDDVHYVIDDRYAPHYPILLTKLLFDALVVLWIVSLAVILRRSRQARTSHLQRDDSQALDSPSNGSRSDSVEGDTITVYPQSAL